MTPPIVPSLLYVPALLIVFILLSGSEIVEGKVSRWCREAHNKDVRIKYQFCYVELKAHSKKRDWEDPWRLAKVSAWSGANNGKLAVQYILALLAKPETDPKIKPALQECQGVYDHLESAFLKAGNKIDSHGYAGARVEVAQTVAWAQQCEDAFARVRVPSPLVKSSFAYNQQIGYICLALISIIDH